jgi:hypothetical protein
MQVMNGTPPYQGGRFSIALAIVHQSRTTGRCAQQFGKVAPHGRASQALVQENEMRQSRVAFEQLVMKYVILFNFQIRHGLFPVVFIFNPVKNNQNCRQITSNTIDSLGLEKKAVKFLGNLTCLTI